MGSSSRLWLCFSRGIMTKRICFLLFSGLLASCAAGRGAPPDMSLIDSLTDEAGPRERFGAPHYVLYGRRGRELVFIASAHEHAVDSGTFRLICEVFDGFEPEVVILEGLSSSGGPSPKGFSGYAERCWGEGGQGDCFENSYAAFLANERGIPYWGGEPDDLAVLRGMRSEGYSLEDLMGFYLFRRMIQLGRKGAIQRDYRRQIEEQLKTIELGFEAAGSGFGAEEFLAWHEERTGKPFDPQRLESDDMAPLDHLGATYIQRLNHHLGMIRERNLVSLEAELASRRERTLVIYGKAHLIKQRRVLAGMFGEPVSEGKSFAGIAER